MQTTAYTHIVEDLAGQLFQVRDAGSTDLSHVFRGSAVKRVRGGFAPKKNAREILVRRLGTRVVANLAAGVVALDPQDETDAGPGLAADQKRHLDTLIHGIGRTDRDAYRGGNGYPRLVGDA